MKSIFQEMKTNSREIKNIWKSNKTISGEIEIEKRKNEIHLSGNEKKISPDGIDLSRDGSHFWRLFLIYNRRFHIYNTLKTN
ncbi:MAG: hypothetical protein LBF89_00395 [Bacteroidales bacterium]|jgi:hypothetical protein|nr:hypothetical protein [Bacteroidales bacterium]